MRITITDGVDAIVDVDLPPGSGLGRYLRIGQALWNARGLRLDDAPLRSLRGGLDLATPLPLGTDAVELTVRAGASAGISIATAGSDGDLFGRDAFGEPIPIPADTAFVGLELQAEVGASLGTEAGDLTFGFDAGQTAGIACYHRVPLAGTTMRKAVSEAVRSFSLPGDIADLQQMPDGDVAVVSGRGQLRFAGEAALTSGVNALASLSLPVAGDLRLTTGATLGIAASVVYTGEYQVRVHKVGSHVRLGVLRQKGSSYSVSVDAVAGASATVGRFDLIELLMRAVSADWKAETETFERAGLPAPQIEAIEAVVKASLRRKVELALEFELAGAASAAEMFLYDVDVDALDGAGREAVHRALDGNLSELTGAAPGSLTGVLPVRSLFTTLRERRHRFGVNLFGVFNAFSVSRFVATGSVMLDEETGDILITDTATSERIRGSMAGWVADPLKLRALVAESVLATAAYRCAGAVAVPPSLRLGHSYFEYHARTKPGTMKDNLDVPEALGLLAAPDKARLLEGAPDFGRSTLFVEVLYDDAALRAAFLDANGRPRPPAEFERAGLRAVLDLVQRGEADDYRRLPAERPEVWDAMKAAGQVNLASIPEIRRRVGDGSDRALRIAVLRADYSTIVWWAGAMSALGTAVADVEAHLAAHPEARAGDHQYRALVRRLAERLRAAVKNMRAQFGDPWGLVAMDIASRRTARVTARITSAVVAWDGARAAVLSEGPAGAAGGDVVS